MKKLIALILSFALVFSLAACSTEKSNDEYRGSVIDKNSASKTEVEFSLGDTKGKKYENKYIGIGCEISNSWSFKTDKEIAEINGLAADYLPEDVADEVENLSGFTDMFASSEDATATINVILSKASSSEIENYSVEQTVELAKDATIQAYKNMGYTDVQVSVKEVYVDGKDCSGMHVVATNGQATVYVQQFSVKCTDHIAIISVVGSSEKLLQDIIERFYWL